VEGMNIVEEQDHPTNHWLGEKSMNMVGSNMMEVDGMDTVERHFHPLNHRSEVESMDIVEEYFHSMNHRPEVEGMNTTPPPCLSGPTVAPSALTTETSLTR
jgi:hypothetical protein